MSLVNFCSSKMTGGGAKFDIVNYCKVQSQIKALTNKNIDNVNTQFDTPYNNTSVSRAMRYSQLVRNGKR
jgi:hypothetical protein